MIDVEGLAWERMGGLVPAVVQHADSGEVRMVGYMNRAALEASIATGFVTFYSRSKQRLWMKGETSGDKLALVAIRGDCDGDALLVLARPQGPTCHRGTASCFGAEGAPGTGFLGELGEVVRERAMAPPEESYTARLMAKGVKRIAQKVGEEGVEAALAGAVGDREELVNEAADLAYHLTVMLEASGLDWNRVMDRLRERHRR